MVIPDVWTENDATYGVTARPSANPSLLRDLLLSECPSCEIGIKIAMFNDDIDHLRGCSHDHVTHDTASLQSYGHLLSS